jgi:hypothetical protein
MSMRTHSRLTLHQRLPRIAREAGRAFRAPVVPDTPFGRAAHKIAKVQELLSEILAEPADKHRKR